MDCLIDTGVLLRLVHRHDPQRRMLLAALRSLHSGGATLATTTQNLREFWNVVSRPATARRGYGQSVEVAAHWIKIFNRLLRILPETQPTFGIWVKLVADYRVSGSRVHDAHLVAIMQSHGIDTILTLNTSDFMRFSQIKALSPLDVLAASSGPQP